MSKRIQYRDEPLGDVRIVPDFLPPPHELVSRNAQTKVTLALSTESVAYFKELAQKHDLQYQKLIRQLLDAYVARHKHGSTRD
jgi:hypothetical protein